MDESADQRDDAAGWIGASPGSPMFMATTSPWNGRVAQSEFDTDSSPAKASERVSAWPVVTCSRAELTAISGGRSPLPAQVGSGWALPRRLRGARRSRGVSPPQIPSSWLVASANSAQASRTGHCAHTAFADAT